jgi:hypothetical protein
MEAHELAGHQVTFAPTVNLVLQPHLAGPQLSANVSACFERNPPRFVDMLDGYKAKGRLAICAGGPSMKGQIDKIRRFDRVMVCASTHEFFVREGIPFDFAVIFDPTPDDNRFYEKTRAGALYLVASICDPSLFEALRDNRVRVWHPAGSVAHEEYRGEPCVTGGSTAALRALVLAYLLGHRRQYLFGFDSSYAGDDRHAYAHPDDADCSRDVRVRFGSREFSTNYQLMSQANEFMLQVRSYGDKFHPIAYGDGLLQTMLRDHRGQ